MRRLALIPIVAVALAFAGATAPTAVAGTPVRVAAPAASVARPAPEFVLFRSRLGFGRSRYGYGYGYGYGRSRPSLLHRAVKTAIWLYVLHLFFTHGGLSILLWVIVIGFLASLMRRRRRYTQRPQSFWS